MNFLNVKVDLDKGIQLNNEYLHLSFPQSEHSGIQNYAGRRITLGVRPEHLQLTSSGPGIQAQLEVSELMGSETYFYTSVGGTQVVARVPAAHRQKAGDILTFYPQFEQLHFFNSETGERID